MMFLIYMNNFITHVEATLHHDGNIEFSTWKFALSDHDHVANTASRSSLLGHQQLFKHFTSNFTGNLRPEG